MSPAAPTRPDATILATDEATAPPLDDPTAAADAADAATPRRADTPADAARTAQIAATFDELAPVHDRMATILSLGMDRRWRAAVVAETRLTPGDSAIDVAAGTGLLATALADRVGPFGRIVALDLSPAMVERGAGRARDIVQLEFLLGDALALPFDDGRFGAATIAFGLGALTDPVAGIRELVRVVRPGGRVICLEPTMPRPRWWGQIQHRTAQRLAPLAASVTVRHDAYRRLHAITSNVPDADALAAILRDAGLVDVRYRRLGLGAVAIHSGTTQPG